MGNREVPSSLGGYGRTKTEAIASLKRCIQQWKDLCNGLTESGPIRTFSATNDGVTIWGAEQDLVNLSKHRASNGDSTR